MESPISFRALYFPSYSATVNFYSINIYWVSSSIQAFDRWENNKILKRKK